MGPLQLHFQERRLPHRAEVQFPWDRYSYEFEAKADWSEIKIPFDEFTKTAFYMPKKLNKNKVRTIAIAAYGKDFYAEIDIANVELF